MSEESKESIELKEKELEAAAGGEGTIWTKNKYDPVRCKGLTQRIPKVCRAVFLEGDCDHFNWAIERGSGSGGKQKINMSCNMGAFPPYSEME